MAVTSSDALLLASPPVLPWLHRAGPAEPARSTEGVQFLDRLGALEPLMKVQSESGFVEYFEHYEARGETSSSAAPTCSRSVSSSSSLRGLLLPRYSNTHALVGRGTVGMPQPPCKRLLGLVTTTSI
ncbi:glutelin type-B 2-like [Phragmites australis]|uniref:glutelin type-B 2-like n=1 Tax=Phragmites australis TaxID=29695 RepID=UPI002D77B769|nr:glutelin type-B 2-like [Phragmites australis]